MIFACENPERDWINDLREAERVRDLPPDEREDWTDGELWTEDDEGPTGLAAHRSMRFR